MKRDLAMIEGCTLRITASQDDAENAEIIVEKDGEELFHGNESFLWLMRWCSPNVGEMISSSLFRGKKV